MPQGHIRMWCKTPPRPLLSSSLPSSACISRIVCFTFRYIHRNTHTICGRERNIMLPSFFLLFCFAFLFEKVIIRLYAFCKTTLFTLEKPLLSIPKWSTSGRKLNYKPNNLFEGSKINIIVNRLGEKWCMFI